MPTSMKNTNFPERVMRHPRAFFTSLNIILSDFELKSFSEAGLRPQDMADAIDQLGITDSDTDVAMEELVRTIAFSEIPASEQAIVEAALSRRQHSLGDYSAKLADFSDIYQTQGALGGPGAAVWLASHSSKFDASAGWECLQKNPAACKAAIEHPEVFFDQAIRQNAMPSKGYGFLDIAQNTPTDVLTAFAHRLFSKDDSKCDAMELIESLTNQLDTHEYNEKSLAILEATIHFWKENPDTDEGFKFLGTLVSCANTGHPDAMALLAREADSIRLAPSSSPPAIGTKNPRAFLFAPDGRGGIFFPRLDQNPLPIFTLADYALAFAGEPVLQIQHKNPTGPTYSAALDELAREIKIQGLDAPPNDRGTPEIMRAYAQAQHRFETSRDDPSSTMAFIEALELRLATRAGCSPTKSPRI